MTDDKQKLAAGLKLAMAASEIFGDCDPHTSDDALIYAGSATWDDWRNHVPQVVRSVWKDLPMVARLAVLITAKSFTMYEVPTTRK